MEQDAVDNNNASLLKTLNDSDERPRSAVNSLILDYYKKFGRKRDLEQYFSLSTAQNEIRDPRSLFWRRMKEQSDTSDSGEKKSESSNEICRISIRCSIPETSEAEKRDTPSNNDSESPPIITDMPPEPSPSGDESISDNHSQKSADATLDTSINKPLSPTSSITSQRKLEWDSLADVGYGNESDRKTSASSLSTLEREVLAQKQQYTLDCKQNSNLGVPTAHSTPVDPNDSKPKGKKGLGKKTITISRKDVDLVEVNVPQSMKNVQPINVNLTKQFSVNLQKDGGMTIDNVRQDITVSPEKKVDDCGINPAIKFDKEIQTSLLRPKEKDRCPVDSLEKASTSAQKNPILIGLNTLKRRHRRKKLRKSRTKLKSRKKLMIRKDITADKDKSGEQVSEAESFEYMPGHMYNQNQLKRQDPNRSNNNIVGNKSSLESSAVHTTDSSKESKYSFNKDLDKTLSVLKSALKEKYDCELKKKLVKEVIQRLLKSNYGVGETTPDFLSVLSLTSKKTPTTSTSEADNTEEKFAHSKPKKSILRVNKFDPMNVASTSQSAPNLPSVVNSDKPVMSYLSKISSSTTTETDLSNNSAKDITSSDNAFAKTSSQELYKKYIHALKKEEAYKQHLREKEMFLKQKLVRSENIKKVPLHNDLSKNPTLKELIKDLTRNNYDDGSGDASKLEGGSSSNFDIRSRGVPRKHRSHSVFTLSSGNSENRNCNLKPRSQSKNTNSPRAGASNWDRNMTSSCNRPVTVTDSSVQVNINQDKPWACNPPNIAEKVKYVCLCSEKTPICPYIPAEIKEVQNCPNPKPKAFCVASQPVCPMHAASVNPNSGEPIGECTRCLQTKISIHPKISDPSVSDLNIVHSAECVQLIHELYKKVSQTNSVCQCSNEKYDCNSYTCKSSKDNMPSNIVSDEQDNLIDDLNAMAPLTDKNDIQSCLGCNKAFANQPEGASDNIVIPIQGTNMMLKLSIGGGGATMNIQDKKVAKDNLMVCHANTLDRENNTDKLKTILKGPPVNKCSISVQAERSPSVVNTSSTTCGFKTNQKQDISPRETDRDKETHAIKSNHGALDSVNALGRNTYPKKVQINDKKPLIRSNTDTDNLGASSGIQTKTIYSKDKDTVSCFRAEMEQTLASKNKLPKPLSDRGTQPQTNKETSSDRTVSESPKSSADEKFQSYKNKYSTDSQRSKEKWSYGAITDEGNPNDLILDVIKDITKRYSKEDTDKKSKKKCFKEIMSALSYLLDTDDSGDGDQEFSKKSRKPKEVQRPKEQSSELELLCKDYLNDAERTKFASRQKHTNLVPRKNNKETSESNMKTGSSSRKTVKSDMGSGSLRSGGQTSSALKNESSRERCLCGCGYSDCKECMTPRSTEYETGKESCKLSEKNKTSVEESTKIKTCDIGCGCDGSSECKDCVKQPSSKYRSDTCSKESTKSNKQESRCHPPEETKATCDKGCGCDGSSECKECGEPPSPKQTTCTSAKTKNQESRCTSPKITKTTCDKGCGCDGSSECNECGEPLSPKPRTCTSAKTKNQETMCTSSKVTKTTCDVGCGCDGSSECMECVEPHSPKRATCRSGKESPRAKDRQVDCNSINKKITTADKGCGWDGSSECGDCVEPQPQKYKTGKCGKESVQSKTHSSPKRTKTSGRSCGCEGSSECSECVDRDSSKCGTDICGKSVRSKRENRCHSPKKTKCDKSCRCGGSSECSECVDYHSSKYGTGKCGKDSVRSNKDTCNSPRKPRTCDRACGCDGTTECTECVEPHSPKHGIGNCGKEPVRTKYGSRCSSPNKTKRTCDKTCGCYGASECKDCSHKTGKCGKETSCRKQEAKKFVNKCVQSTVKRVKSLYSHCDESSDLPVSTDQPCCSTDSPTAKFVNKIKKECEKYQKRKVCKCEASSSTTVSCDHCRRADKSHCRHRKCRCHRSRSTEKVKKKCVAYNLILQTSDSLISEEAVFDKCRKLQNVIIRVPKCKHANVPFREACAKIEQKLPYCDTRFEPKGRSQSWPNDCGVSSTDDVKMAKACTVRDYLEINRPDFIDKCATRQNCIRMTSESRAKERSELREQLVGLGSLPSLNNEELIYLAKQLGFRRNRPLRQKIMSEREMKKHSEKIYKTLPEVTQKKEDAKKESVKKTNLLMANIFKKNLQKKALSGDVNISNYSQVVKI